MGDGRRRRAFHVHTHGRSGVPDFSGTDVRENAKFVPDFFKVLRNAPTARSCSATTREGRGLVERKGLSHVVDAFVEVGMPSHGSAA